MATLTLERLLKTAVLVGFLGGVPYGLLTQVGSPLPAHLPSWPQLRELVTRSVSDTLVVHLLAAAVWILWAAFAACVVVEIAAALRGVPAPRLHLLSPLQTLAGWLLAGFTAGAMATATPLSVAAALPPAPAAVTVQTQPAGDTPVPHSTVHGTGSVTGRMSLASWQSPLETPAAAPPLPAETGVLLTDRCAYLHPVKPGDSLWTIAEQCAGEGRRWPEIWQLNKGRTWPAVTGYQTFNDPDLIHPTWQLRLPPSWAPPPDAREVEPTRPPTDGPPPSGSPTTPPTSSAPATPDPDDGLIAVPTPTPATSKPDSASPWPSTTAPEESDPATTPNTGVTLPGGWITLPLAAALLGAAAMVWKRRRHRYRPGPLTPPGTDDADLRPLPPAITAMRRAVREHAPHLLHPPTSDDLTVAEYAAAPVSDRPELPPIGPSGADLAGLADLLVPGGLGLTGPGAEPAARALLVATLSAGTPADPDARGQVITPADALTTLLGADAVDLATIPRLAVTATFSEALTRVEELLIERRRLLEEHDALDLPGMRAADPYHPPMPPVLLLAEVPPPESRARLSTALHLGTPLQIHAVLLGDWPRGDTLTVNHDGHPTSPDRSRLAVLDVPTTLELLRVLGEAHTGRPPRATTAPPAPGGEAPTDIPASDTKPATPATATDPEPGAPTGQPPVTPQLAFEQDAPSPGQPSARRVRIRLLGPPTVLDGGGQSVTGLRLHATELLVYLAVHRTGADLPDIMEAFWPTATLRRASERLSTEAGNLRRRLREAAGDPNIQPVTNTGGRYHLNPDLLDVDTWQVTDALQRAAATTDPAARLAALRQAVNAHTGTLADGCDYDWIEAFREQYRRHGIRARLHLADLLTDTDARQAADLTQAAADIDPYNEDIAQRAMRASARLGDTTAVRDRLQLLRAALDEIDEEPSRETITLAGGWQTEPAPTAPG